MLQSDRGNASALADGGADYFAEAEVATACAADARFHAEARDFAQTMPNTRAKKIVERCARRHGVSVDEIMGRSRSRPIVAARYEAIRIVKRVFDWSTPHLGEFFGGRDHTTILWALGRTAQSRAVARKVPRA